MRVSAVPPCASRRPPLPKPPTSRQVHQILHPAAQGAPSGVSTRLGRRGEQPAARARAQPAKEECARVPPGARPRLPPMESCHADLFSPRYPFRRAKCVPRRPPAPHQLAAPSLKVPVRRCTAPWQCTARRSAKNRAQSPLRGAMAPLDPAGPRYGDLQDDILVMAGSLCLGARASAQKGA